MLVTVHLLVTERESWTSQIELQWLPVVTVTLYKKHWINQLFSKCNCLKYCIQVDRQYTNVATLRKLFTVCPVHVVATTVTNANQHIKWFYGTCSLQHTIQQLVSLDSKIDIL